MKYVTRVRWYRVDGDGELRVSNGGNEREVRVMYERKQETELELMRDRYKRSG